MRKRVRIALAVVVVAVVGVIAWQMLRSQEREPVYQGEPLSIWLVRYGTNHFPAVVDAQLDQQAQTAIRQIGTNAIPAYLRIITTRDSSFKLRLMALVPNRWLARLHVRSSFDYRLHGAFGLVALGVEARAAIPVLIALLNDKNQDIRYVAGLTLDSLAPVAGDDLLPFLEKCLEDLDVMVQEQAIRLLGQIQQKPERVVPALVAILAKPPDQQESARLRVDALRALRQLGARAKPAVPRLVELLNDADAQIRAIAASALKTIDPEAAAKAGVK